MEVDAIAEMLEALGRGNVFVDGGAHILGVLAQDVVTLGRRQLFHQDIEAPRHRPHMVVKIKAVNGVDDDRDPRQPRRQLAEEARLGVVGVHDVDALPLKDAGQVHHRGQVW